LKLALQTIWEELPQERINMAVANYAYMAVAVSSSHFEHLQ